MRVYEPGQVIQFHAAVTEHGVAWKPGDTAVVTGHDLWAGVLVKSTLAKAAPQRLPIHRSSSFNVFAEDWIGLASGDLLRIIPSGWTRNGHYRLGYESIVELHGFTREGHLLLSDGRVIDREFGM